MQEKLSILLNEDYISAIVLFITMLIIFLLYLTISYKKTLKKQSTQLLEKDEKIKSLRQYSYEMEVKKVDREHEVEKEMMNLNHEIKALETSKKEGLKSHIVMMIEAFEKKRTQQLERAAVRR